MKIATADVTPVSISSIVGAMPKTFLGRLKTSPLTRKCDRGGRRLERRRLGQCTDRRENIGIPLTTLQPPSRVFQSQARNLDRGTNTTLIEWKN